MLRARKPGSRRKQEAVPASRKRPFDIEETMRRLREATAPHPKAALFELAAEGHTSVFEILVACIISIRTRDETTLPVARALFARARAPAEVAALSVEEIDRLIGACTFHRPKAKTIRDLAGDGDHYAATVLAESFRGKSRVQQHQIVYEALKAEMGGKLHALALQTGTPER